MQAAMRVWREGFMPQFTDDELRLLCNAISEHPDRFICGRTFLPDALNPDCVGAACPLGYLSWQGRPGIKTADVMLDYRSYSLGAQQRLGGPEDVRPYFAWFDGDLLSLAYRLQVLRDECYAELQRRVAA